jgi:hypothetical protein
MTAPKINEVLNEISNDKKIEMLIDQAPKEKEVKKTPQQSVSVPITHGKSDTEAHTMELNQSDERQQKNPSLCNPHPSRQVDSGGGGDHFTKAPNKNGGRKRHFTKAPNMKNGGPKKQAKSPDITHHKDPNRTAKA